MTSFHSEMKCNENNKYENLAKKTFSLIELIELAGIKGQEFIILRKKLLNIGNDILRLKDGDDSATK